MNRVEISFQDISAPLWADALEAFCLKALGALEIGDWELSVLLCGRETIKELNCRYRGIDQPTDVLSFELGVESPENGGRYLPGDIIISLDNLRENSIYFRIPEDEELRRLLVHGILHLKGMDHKTNEQNEPMLVLQEEILKKLEGNRILPEKTQNGRGEW
ncbi:MAG: rRNA maturation RNase YbeY [Spirochaetes bacterium]|nr:rRNA maturation RNase YbeY [Spirochaetota bacterium]